MHSKVQRASEQIFLSRPVFPLGAAHSKSSRSTGTMRKRVSSCLTPKRLPPTTMDLPLRVLAPIQVKPASSQLVKQDLRPKLALPSCPENMPSVDSTMNSRMHHFSEHRILASMASIGRRIRCCFANRRRMNLHRLANGPSDGKSFADGKSGRFLSEPVPATKPKLSDQGLYLFSLFTCSPKYNNILPFYFHTGLVYKGLIPTRDNDQLMVVFGFGQYSFYNVEARQQKEMSISRTTQPCLKLTTASKSTNGRSFSPICNTSSSPMEPAPLRTRRFWASKPGSYSNIPGCAFQSAAPRLPSALGIHFLPKEVMAKWPLVIRRGRMLPLSTQTSCSVNTLHASLLSFRGVSCCRIRTGAAEGSIFGVDESS